MQWPLCECVATMLQLKRQILYIIWYVFIYNYIFMYKKCKLNLDLYWIIKNVPIYCKYNLKFLGIWSNYFIFLEYAFFPIHSSLTYKGHMRETPSLKILLSVIDLKACQITLLDSIRAVFITQSSYNDEFASQK